MLGSTSKTLMTLYHAGCALIAILGVLKCGEIRNVEFSESLQVVILIILVHKNVRVVCLQPLMHL